MRHYSLYYVNQLYLNTSVYDPPCPNKCFMNSLRRSFFYLFIAISYIELHITLMGHGVVGVEEVDVALFPPYFEPALSQTHLCMIHHVPISAL